MFHRDRTKKQRESEEPLEDILYTMPVDLSRYNIYDERYPGIVCGDIDNAVRTILDRVTAEMERNPQKYDRLTLIAEFPGLAAYYSDGVQSLTSKDFWLQFSEGLFLSGCRRGMRTKLQTFGGSTMTFDYRRNPPGDFPLPTSSQSYEFHIVYDQQDFDRSIPILKLLEEAPCKLKVFLQVQ